MEDCLAWLSSTPSQKKKRAKSICDSVHFNQEAKWELQVGGIYSEVLFLKKKSRGWRDSSAIKNSCCSFRRSMWIQFPALIYDGFITVYNTSSRKLDAVFLPLCAQCTPGVQTSMQVRHPYTKSKNKSQEKTNTKEKAKLMHFLRLQLAVLQEKQKCKQKCKSKWKLRLQNLNGSEMAKKKWKYN